MAYVITLNNQLQGIAANESDKNDYNVFFPPSVAVEISDSDFNKLKNDTGNVQIAEDGSVTIVDNTTTPVYDNLEDLQKYTNSVKQKMKYFLEPACNNNSKGIYNSINTYNNLLKNFDWSTITFPLNKTWEQHCEDNSIEYVSPLQIP